MQNPYFLARLTNTTFTLHLLIFFPLGLFSGKVLCMNKERLVGENEEQKQYI